MSSESQRSRPEFPGQKGPLPGERSDAPKFFFDDEVLKVHNENRNDGSSQYVMEMHSTLCSIFSGIKKEVDRKDTNYYPVSLKNSVDEFFKVIDRDFDQINFLTVGISGESLVSNLNSFEKDFGNDAAELPVVSGLQRALQLWSVMMEHVPKWKAFKSRCESALIDDQAVVQ
jgi:hypothetical protein